MIPRIVLVGLGVWMLHAPAAMAASCATPSAASGAPLGGTCTLTCSGSTNKVVQAGGVGVKVVLTCPGGGYYSSGFNVQCEGALGCSGLGSFGGSGGTCQCTSSTSPAGLIVSAQCYC